MLGPACASQLGPGYLPRRAGMRFDEFKRYQAQAMATAIYPEDARVIYPALGLANEAGEVLGKIKKVIRDQQGDYTDESREAIEAELGDVLWYVAALCHDLDLDLGRVAEKNIEKLRDRSRRGKVGGTGDTR